MSRLPTLIAWILATAICGAVSALKFYVELNAIAVSFGLATVLSALMAQDEFHIYRRNRKREPRVEPPTRIPDFPEQRKRPIR